MTPIEAALDLLKSLKLGETPNYAKNQKSTVAIEIRYRGGTEVFRALRHKSLKINNFLTTPRRKSIYNTLTAFISEDCPL